MKRSLMLSAGAAVVGALGATALLLVGWWQVLVVGATGAVAGALAWLATQRSTTRLERTVAHLDARQTMGLEALRREVHDLARREASDPRP